ncbi:hypothetical protein [Chitinophaga japonensis]|uniref:hypothetical protein n=1 Tax=Chitinophaga japonensis TaxID=104662 RepID=UPI0011A5B2AD|nr:hypothetical protein [Chitinophaga japonensis]
MRKGLMKKEKGKEKNGFTKTGNDEQEKRAERHPNQTVRFCLAGKSVAWAGKSRSHFSIDGNGSDHAAKAKKDRPEILGLPKSNYPQGG